MQRLFAPMRGRFFALAREFDLAPGQMAALVHLEPGSPRPMTELAEVLHCDNSNVTGLVDRLEQRGYVKRRPAEHDRRVKMLEVTAEGEHARAMISAQLNQPPPEINSLSAEEQRQLRDLLKRALGDS
jgi:MarR family transcriptional regulator, organic hydroperoxide resistance regulator